MTQTTWIYAAIAIIGVGGLLYAFIVIPAAYRHREKHMRWYTWDYRDNLWYPTDSDHWKQR